MHRGLRSWVISFYNREGLEVTYEDYATTVPRAAAGEVDGTQLWVAMMWHCKLDLPFLFKLGHIWYIQKNACYVHVGCVA